MGDVVYMPYQAEKDSQKHNLVFIGSHDYSKVKLSQIYKSLSVAKPDIVIANQAIPKNIENLEYD